MAVHHTLTRHVDTDGDWQGVKGRITKELLAACKFPEPSEDTLIVYCGPPAFNKTIEEILLNSMGYSKDMLHKFWLRFIKSLVIYTLYPIDSLSLVQHLTDVIASFRPLLSAHSLNHKLICWLWYMLCWTISTAFSVWGAEGRRTIHRGVCILTAWLRRVKFFFEVRKVAHKLCELSPLSWFVTFASFRWKLKIAFLFLNLSEHIWVLGNLVLDELFYFTDLWIIDNALRHLGCFLCGGHSSFIFVVI